jgi:ribosomal protein S18 acetylase RimI-like enzyme
VKLSPIEFSTGDTADIATFLADRIYEFNADATGLRDGDVFAATIKDDAGAIVAGVNGHTWGGCCHIANLWVRRSLRGWGLGARLVAAVESHARSKGCTQIVLSSHTFQAPEYYRKLGFVEQARIPGYPNGHADIHFLKFLGAGDA